MGFSNDTVGKVAQRIRKDSAQNGRPITQSQARERVAESLRRRERKSKE